MSAGCSCTVCRPRAAPSDAPAESRRRPLGVGIFGVRAPNAPSRFAELRILDRRRELGDFEELSPGHRRLLGLDRAGYERQSRADFAVTEPERVHRPLTPAEASTALAALREWPVRRQFKLTTETFAEGRARRRRDASDWMHEVWRELVEPPADVAPVADLPTRIKRAVWRAEDRLRKQFREVALPETTLDVMEKNHG